MPDGLRSIEEALAAAEAELGEANPSEIPEAPPAEEEHDSAPDEHADAQADEATAEESEENPLDLLSDEEVEGGEWPAPGSTEWWGQEVEVDTSAGPTNISLDEMRKGYMRQADYTRKTQDLARERQLVSEASEFYQAFRENPLEFARYIAVRSGLVDDAENLQEVKGVKVWTEDQIQEEAEKRAQEIVQSHPDITAAKQHAAVAAVEQAFTDIESNFNTRLSKEHRVMILREAQRQGTTNLRLVYEALLSRAMQKAAQRDATRAVAPSRPASAPREEAAPQPKAAGSVAEAFEMALAELQEEIA